MKFRVVLLAAIAWSCGALPASAEPRSISAQAGWTAPYGDLADGVRDGPYVGISANQPIGKQHLLFLDFNCHKLREKTTDVLPGYLAISQDVQITETAVGLRSILTPPRVPIAPYLKFGVALEFVDPKLVFDTNYESVYYRDPRFWPGFLFATGVSVPLGSSAGLRLEGMIHAIESNPTAVNLGTVGLSFWARFSPL